MSKDVSPLAPVGETLADELAFEAHDEQEKSAPWIVRKLVGVSRRDYRSLGGGDTERFIVHDWANRHVKL